LINFHALDKALIRLVKSAALKSSDKADSEIPASSNAFENDDAMDSFTNPQAVERRVWRNTFVVIALALIAAGFFADLKFILGLALGSVLALLNYKWLHSSLKDALSTGTGKPQPGTMMMFVVRWLVVATVVYGANLTGYFDGIAMLAGLFAPALAVIVEAAYVTYKTLAHSGEDHK
jgi:hypothetical protein